MAAPILKLEPRQEGRQDPREEDQPDALRARREAWQKAQEAYKI